MKPSLAILFAAVVAAVAMAQNSPPYTPGGGEAAPYQPSVPVAPQVYGGGDGYGWGGSGGGTAAGNTLHGMASVVNAAGNYNLATSAAAVNMTQAQKQEIQNWSSFTNTYFDMRALNRKATAEERGKPLTEEQMIRMAQAGVPKPLSTQQLDPVSGQIAWPALLQDPSFQQQRTTLEAAFAERAKAGNLPYSVIKSVREASQSMLDQLAGMIRDVAPNDYIAAKKFIQSLAYAMRQPVA